MKRIIRSLPLGAEFAIVMAVAFVPAIITSLSRWWKLIPQKPFTDHNLLGLAIFELAVGAALVLFLWIRDWRPRKIGLLPTFKDTGIGLLVLAATTLIWIAISYVIFFISPSTIAQMRDVVTQLKGPVPSPVILVGVSLINAVFEEIFVSGYIITALKPIRGPVIAAGISAAVRLSYHLYQGQMAFLGIAPLGVAYAIWYARTGRLWPLIVAHAVQDILALSL